MCRVRGFADDFGIEMAKTVINYENVNSTIRFWRVRMSRGMIKQSQVSLNLFILSFFKPWLQWLQIVVVS